MAPESCESLSTSSLTGALYVYQCLQYTNSTGSFIQGTAAYEWLKVKLLVRGQGHCHSGGPHSDHSDATHPGTKVLLELEL